MRRALTGISALLLAVAIFAPQAARAVSSTVVISEFRVRGPNGGSDEFIELHNVSDAPVDISGWKLNGSNNFGTASTRATVSANTILQPRCFYLFTNSSTSGGPYSGNVPGDQTYATGITDDGGVAILNSSNAVIDQVGLSAGSAYKEGTPLASLGSSNFDRGYERKSGGATLQDTDDNANDFVIRTPSQPQSRASPCQTSTPPTAAAIHDIQGSGATSPFVGQFIVTEGVVTARRFNNGFFMQQPDAEADVDTNTSEGIFVFTASAPPAAAQVGARVRVTGTVAEFAPDPGSLPATEITSPIVVQLSTGNSLPGAITLTSADTNPLGPLDQLERLEGMRVHVDTLTVVAPTNGAFVSGNQPPFPESNAITRTDGVYYGVLPGIQRPFRQPGVQLPLPLPPGSPCCVDRFDGNPERIRVDSNGNTAFSVIDTTEVMTGATVSNITGVLDYSTNAYTIIPDAGGQGTVSGLHGYTPVSAAAPHRFTIATANLERFFDKIDDAGISDVAMSDAGYSLRLSKMALQICDVMRAPDIIGVEEVENIGVLNAIAAAANASASCGGTQYHAYLFEGNDPGGIDDGLLVNASRVVVNEVHQEGKDTTFTDPTDGSTDLLNDRPPTVLHATIAAPGSAPQDITVIANHLRSLNDIDADGPFGAGPRVRMKRLKQAEFLGKLIEDLQFASGADPVVAVGDFNAFEFSDGYVDVIGTISGAPVPADHVVLASTNVPNTSAPLTDLITADNTLNRYSYSFDGNAQSLDHVLVTSAAVQIFDHIEWGHSNADFPETMRGDATRPERLSDHDPVVAYFVLAATTTTTVSAAPNPAWIDGDITFTATVGTPAPVPSGFVQFSDGAGYTASVAVVNGQASVVVPAASFGLGAHTMTASFSDGINFAPSSGVAHFTVVALSVTPNVLWPANHKMVDVEVKVRPADSGVTCAISRITSSESDNGLGDGDTANDVGPTAGVKTSLRAERSGLGEGRLYTLTVTCSDRAGNSASSTIGVGVPKSR